MFIMIQNPKYYSNARTIITYLSYKVSFPKYLKKRSLNLHTTFHSLKYLNIETKLFN